MRVLVRALASTSADARAGTGSTCLVNYVGLAKIEGGTSFVGSEVMSRYGYGSSQGIASAGDQATRNRQGASLPRRVLRRSSFSAVLECGRPPHYSFHHLINVTSLYNVVILSKEYRGFADDTNVFMLSPRQLPLGRKHYDIASRWSKLE